MNHDPLAAAAVANQHNPAANGDGGGSAIPSTRWGGGPPARANDGGVDGGADEPGRWQQFGGFSWARAWTWLSDSTKIHSYLLSAGLLVVISLIFFLFSKPPIIMTKTDDGIVTNTVHGGKLALILGVIGATSIGACFWLNGVPAWS
jgi:hypothetical protein